MLLLTVTSCGEDFFSAPIEFDIDEIENQVSVIGRLISIPDETIGFTDFESVNNLGFFISRSKSVLDTLNFEIIENAKVRVTGSDGTDIEYPFDKNSGYYFPENVRTLEIERLVVKDNINYSLTVEVPGEDLIIANVSTQTFGKLESAELKLNDIIPEENYALDKLTLNIIDPPGKNYYSLRTFYKIDRVGQDGELFPSQRQGYIYNVNSALDGEASLFTDEKFDGESVNLEFWSERYIETINDLPIDPESIFISLWTLTEEEYRFRESIRRNRDAADNPFAEPAIVFSNIENGIGVFSLIDAQIYEIKL